MDDKFRKEAIGKRLRVARKEKRLSQKELQALTGIKDSMISGFECGVREPNVANLAKLAHALDMTMDDLYFGDESNRFIENAPNKGMKIVNCFTELTLDEVVWRVEGYDEDYGVVEPPYIVIHKHVREIKRLLDGIREYRENINTYTNPELYLEQIKESVANEINGNLRRRSGN